MENIKSELSKIGIILKNRNTESIIFFKKMGDLNFKNKTKDIITNSSNKDFCKVFQNCEENSKWLELYDFLYKNS
ncbi:MAG: hypothetical protein KBC42_03470 [Candidatus Pacebacteria bacterium]|nr:hypothetical protein [Candidatus Paceibacterota bacterium]MBP9780956.1 hypothetical protein [Candidatus Paceibacterota bacterium]